MVIKYTVHRKLKELLEQDLSQKVKMASKKKGVNTYFFGDNRQGKCGIGNDEALVTKPQCLFTKLRSIAAGHHHNMALDKNGVLYSWGRNRFGQLGQGVADEDLEPGQDSGLNTSLP